MEPVPSRRLSAPAIRSAAFARIAAAGAALLAAGCLDMNPGGAQSQSQAVRAESSSPGHPECIDATLLLVLDHDAVAPGRAPQHFSERDVGCDRERPGNRHTLDWFARNIGQETLLPAGEVGDEGWFAPTSVRISWKSAGPDYGDGLRNYADAGPGLGSPDAKGHTETLLENVPGLAPLRATGLARLVGRSACAVVLARNVVMNYGPTMGDIRGDNRGRIAFQVLGLADAPTSHSAPFALPSVRIRVLDADAVCAEPLAAFPEAPLPTSRMEPRDVQPPSCAVQREYLNEPWNGFDTSLWRGDADVAVSGGLFFAREGAYSAAADWVPKCPIAVDTAFGVRFTNRVQLQGPTANSFTESGALFMINADADGAFRDYAFMNIGFTGQPGKVFVELFGASGGQDFDQFEETSLASSPSLSFSVDLWMFKDSYQVAVGGEAIDTVKLASPLNAVSLFEAGVQQNGGGLRGLIDQTTVSVQCKTVTKQIHQCRPHSRHRFCARQGRIYCNPEDREPQSSQVAASTLVVGNIRGRNNLIRMAREKVRHLANPPKGLLMLSKLKETPDPTQY